MNDMFWGHYQLDWLASREVFYGRIRHYQPELEEEVSYKDRYWEDQTLSTRVRRGGEL
jgi:hypothetical protein